jgi:hypothetical protein
MNKSKSRKVKSKSRKVKSKPIKVKSKPIKVKSKSRKVKSKPIKVKSKSRKVKSKSRKVKSKSKSRKVKSSKQLIILQKSNRPDKKYMVTIDSKTIHFGAKGYKDLLIHKDLDRMKRYENRHKSRENWKKSGLKTAGFWSKWILWNKPSFRGSIKDTEKRFNIKIVYKR